jgi:hypothetical protein
MSELPKYISRDTDRHGNVRYYYRRNGQRTRLRGEPGSADFLSPVLAGHPNPKVSKITGFVYFALYGKRVKIGTCANVKSRLQGIQSGMPGRVRVHYVTPGGRALESELHNLFAADRVTGEWFRYSTAIREWIKADQARRAAERGW